jgi:RNA polymerase sigma-70 factor (ECF subfamily)
MSISTHPEIPVSEMIEGCIKGNRRMQELLYQTYAPKMFGICLRYTGATADAQDVLQDGFIKAFNKLEGYKSEGSFEGWLKRIFIHTAIDQLHKKNPVQTITDVQENIIEDMDWSVLEQLAAEEVMELVRQLPDSNRTIFNLFVVEGYTHKNIAEMLGISEGTSKAQLAKAKGILQSMLSRNRNFTP